MDPMTSIFDDIRVERQRQDDKWGTPQRHTIDRWLTIMGEETGEACKARLTGDVEGFIKELTHALAVGVALLEHIELGEILPDPEDEAAQKKARHRGRGY